MTYSKIATFYYPRKEITYEKLYETLYKRGWQPKYYGEKYGKQSQLVEENYLGAIVYNFERVPTHKDARWYVKDDYKNICTSYAYIDREDTARGFNRFGFYKLNMRTGAYQRKDIDMSEFVKQFRNTNYKYINFPDKLQNQMRTSKKNRSLTPTASPLTKTELFKLFKKNKLKTHVRYYPNDDDMSYYIYASSKDTDYVYQIDKDGVVVYYGAFPKRAHNKNEEIERELYKGKYHNQH